MQRLHERDIAGHVLDTGRDDLVHLMLPMEFDERHELIAEHLEAVTRGEIRKLLISVPPRCSKTSLVNVCWPAWIWAQPEIGPLSGPQVRFMCLSYGQTLSIDIATTARRLVMGPWYQRHWHFFERTDIEPPPSVD
jgi:hypothetical protein